MLCQIGSVRLREKESLGSRLGSISWMDNATIDLPSSAEIKVSKQSQIVCTAFLMKSACSRKRVRGRISADKHFAQIWRRVTRKRYTKCLSARTHSRTTRGKGNWQWKEMTKLSSQYCYTRKQLCYNASRGFCHKNYFQYGIYTNLQQVWSGTSNTASGSAGFRRLAKIPIQTM